MTWHVTDVDGVWFIEPDRHADDRGFFAVLYDAEALGAHGLPVAYERWAVSHNDRRATLRGLHFQGPPHADAKLVRCTRGSVYDVAVDIRPDSPTYRKWTGADLTADNRCVLAIPAGFAHGFITLEDDSEVAYALSSPWAPDAEGGVRWDDPGVSVSWPIDPEVMSERDATLPDFEW